MGDDLDLDFAFDLQPAEIDPLDPEVIDLRFEHEPFYQRGNPVADLILSH